jgi:predicted MFS family arabinose efflux permease
MNFKFYLLFGIGSILGTALAVLISDKISPRQLTAKGIAALLIGFFIVPAFMPYFDLPIEVWSGINAIASVIGVEIIVLLTKKLKEVINNKIKIKTD